MKQLKRYMILGICFVLFTGTLSHFLYEWTENNFVIGLFAPVNESVWEHMKLIFFPMLLYSFAGILKLRKSYPCIGSAFCFGILTGTVLIPIFLYLYLYSWQKYFCLRYWNLCFKHYNSIFYSL